MNKIIVLITLLVLAYNINNVYAQEYMKTGSKSLDVEMRISPSPIMPDNQTRFDIRFITKGTNQTQVHIDYVVYINDPNNNEIFRTPLTHTNEGEITIPYIFSANGNYKIFVEMYGINFIPIPKETVEFNINVIPEFPLGGIIILSIITLASVLIRKPLLKL